MASQKNSITAKTLMEAARVMATEFPDAANICLTSHKGEQDLRQQLQEMMPSANQGDAIGVVHRFMGIEIVPAIEIETEHGFFFKNWDDAEDFLMAVRKSKANGVSWATILSVMEAKFK